MFYIVVFVALSAKLDFLFFHNFLFVFKRDNVDNITARRVLIILLESDGNVVRMVCCLQAITTTISVICYDSCKNAYLSQHLLFIFPQNILIIVYNFVIAPYLSFGRVPCLVP